MKRRKKLKRAIKKSLEIIESDYKDDSDQDAVDRMLVKVQRILAEFIGEEPWVSLQEVGKDRHCGSCKWWAYNSHPSWCDNSNGHPGTSHPEGNNRACEQYENGGDFPNWEERWMS